MQVLLIDNFDSFTYNLYDYISQLSIECEVVRNNDESLFDKAESSDVIVLSPGPGVPDKAGNMMQIIEKFVNVKPFLGICLGHQALGVHFGMQLVKAEIPMHGICSNLTVQKHPIFDGIENGFQVMRYHSLLLKKGECKDFRILAESETNEIMLIQHQELPITGMQFHPESVLTYDGLKLLYNWFRLINKGFHLYAIFFYITTLTYIAF